MRKYQVKRSESCNSITYAVVERDTGLEMCSVGNYEWARKLAEKFGAEDDMLAAEGLTHSDIEG